MKDEYPKAEELFVVGKDMNCFRSGKPAKIISVKMGYPDYYSERRVVYEIEFSDGKRDYIPVSEVGSVYELYILDELIKNKFKP